MKHSSTNPSLGPTMVPQARMRPIEGGGGSTGILSRSRGYLASSDASLFSSSLPVFPREKLNLRDIDPCHGVADDLSHGINLISEDSQGRSLVENVEEDAIGSLLPDDEKDLLAGVMDDFDLSLLSGSVTVEDMEEEDDLFGSGGGMELEGNQVEDLSISISKINFSDGVIGNGASLYNVQNSSGSVMGEHPYGEHPSRTLFVRNINSNVEDSELKTLFEQYGDIRTLYTACKHRGFVMISYYDIRAARTAMRALQNKPLRRRKLDIHFSIPKDNPSDKDINQGTLVVFNLDSSVSNEDLLQIFGAYGEVKEIRETPHKRHHKFVEFYDVRAAEAALKSLNRCDIAGKRIKLEPSRPGGARRNFMLQLNQDVEQDEPRSFQQSIGSPATNSPPGNWVQMNKPIEQSPVQSVSQTSIFSGLASTPLSSSSGKVAPIGKDQRMSSLADNSFPSINSIPKPMFQQPSSSSESKINGECEASSDRSVMETLSAPEFLWGSHSSRIPVSSNGKGQSHFPSYAAPPADNTHLRWSFPTTAHFHHIGSAPAGFPMETQFGFVSESPQSSFLGPHSHRGFGITVNNMQRHDLVNAGISAPRRNISMNHHPNYRIMASAALGPIFVNGVPFPSSSPIVSDSFYEQGRSRRGGDHAAVYADNKKQFQLDLDKIINGEDARTTLMIKNIPNKYTSKMLLAAIDEHHRGTYDFLYLPIDFKNKCNVGYAFINMLSSSDIIPFYEAFNGNKWEKFNSEKVASLAYARIQGKAALVAHFQNSSLMNEDKRCRPILIYSSDDQKSGQQINPEIFVAGSMNAPRHRPPDGSPPPPDSPRAPAMEGSKEIQNRR